MSANNKPSAVGIKSHIQMPKLLLKRFHNKHNRFCYYHVEHGYIGTKGTAESINTQPGYYSEEMEHYLRDNVETPFSRILSFLDSVDFDGESFEANSSFERSIRTFTYALLARDPIMMVNSKNADRFAKVFSDQALHDFSARFGINFAEQKDIFSEYIVTFMVNKTQIPFVLPVSGLYEYSIRGESIINLPISPTLAICLVHQGYADRVVRENGMISFLLIEDTEDGAEKIQFMNDVAFTTQKRLQWGYTICVERDELDRLVNKYR